MKSLLGLLLVAALLPSPLFATDLNWDRPNWGADGTALTELTGYRVYLSNTSGVYTTPTATVLPTTVIPPTGPTVEKWTIPLTTVKGVYFATVTAYNSTAESDKSNEVTFTVKPGKPGRITNLRVVP